jgi:hypothetical protein
MTQAELTTKREETNRCSPAGTAEATATIGR